MKSIRLIALAACLGLCAFAADSGKPPNMLVILVDDLRWDDLGCAGHPFSKTPHMDRIATEGARFLNAFATTPLCSPSRACLLTGLYAHAHGITDNTERSAQSHKLVTFPQALQKAGYRTCFIGKWHMGNDDSPRAGFDHWVSVPPRMHHFLKPSDSPSSISAQKHHLPSPILCVSHPHRFLPSGMK
ncbi:MAG: sulfatase-like hydrolase/transferase [Chthoniobacteraceae bacterium]